MKLKAQFCCGEGQGGGDLHTFESDDINEIKQWANNLSRTRGFRSIFNDEFQIHRPNFDQWGTDYYWLSIERK